MALSPSLAWGGFLSLVVVPVVPIWLLYGLGWTVAWYLAATMAWGLGLVFCCWLGTVIRVRRGTFTALDVLQRLHPLVQNTTLSIDDYWMVSRHVTGQAGASALRRDPAVLLRWLRAGAPATLYAEAVRAAVPDEDLAAHLDGRRALDVLAVQALAALCR